MHNERLEYRKALDKIKNQHINVKTTEHIQEVPEPEVDISPTKPELSVKAN